MYKVRTNQIYTPFPRLRVNVKSKPVAREVPIDPRLSRASSVSSEEPELPERSTVTAIPAQRRATLKTPTLFPTPVLKPTGYSSRMIFGPPLESIKEGSLETSPRNTASTRQNDVRPTPARHSSETTIVYAEQTPARTSNEEDRAVSASP